MAPKDLLLTLPLWAFDTVVNTLACAIGFVCLIPVALWKLVTGGRGGWKRLTRIHDLWRLCATVPFGRRVFDAVVCMQAPYAGSMTPRILELTPTSVKGQLRERPWLHNPFNSVHAVALTNLGELVTGLAVVGALEGPSRGRGIVTRIETDYMKKARGTITATTTLPATFPTQPGHYDFVIDALLKDREGAQVATVRVTWRLSLPDLARLPRT